MRRHPRSVAVLLALLAAGCGPRPGHPAAALPVEVHVVNQNRSDVNLYLVRGGTRMRMGTVVAGDSHVFPLRHLPGSPVQQLSFEVQRIGAEGVFTLPRVSVSPGQAIHIRLQELITTSEVYVGDDGPQPPAKELP